MHAFIIGITGKVGALVADNLKNRGDEVTGLVRKAEQRDALAGKGIDAEIGDLTTLSPEQLSKLFGSTDAVIFTAGAAGGGNAATTKIDGEGVSTAIAAAKLAQTPRFLLVSVFPEAWRERNLGEDFDHYIAVKKDADRALSQSGLDWVILRPAALTDDPGQGTISLGPAEIHTEITRSDAADTLAAVLHETVISQQILEVTEGTTPIRKAVADNVHPVRTA